MLVAKAGADLIGEEKRDRDHRGMQAVHRARARRARRHRCRRCRRRIAPARSPSPLHSMDAAAGASEDGAYSNLKFHRELTYTIPCVGLTGRVPASPKSIAAIPGSTPMNVNMKALSCRPASRRIGAGTGRVGPAQLTSWTNRAACRWVTQVSRRSCRSRRRSRWRKISVGRQDCARTRPVQDLRDHRQPAPRPAASHRRQRLSREVTNVHNGHVAPPYNLLLQGDAADAKANLTFVDLPIAANALSTEGSKVIENASTISGPMNSAFPLTATVKRKLQMK